VQAVHKTNQVEIFLGIVLRRRDAKMNVAVKAGLGSALPGNFNRLCMTVEAVECRIRIFLRQDNRRSTVPTTDVGNFSARFQFLVNTVQ